MVLFYRLWGFPLLKQGETLDLPAHRRYVVDQAASVRTATAFIIFCSICICAEFTQNWGYSWYWLHDTCPLFLSK